MTNTKLLTVTDREFFAGTLAALNSFHHHNRAGLGATYHFHIVYMDDPETPALCKKQRGYLEGLPKSMYTIHRAEEFTKQPGRVHGAWQIKTYAANHILNSGDEFDVLVGFDSDLFFVSNIQEEIEECMLDKAFLGGRDGSGPIYDSPEYDAYEFRGYPLHNDTYMSTSCYFAPNCHETRVMFRYAAEATNKAVYGPQEQKIYAGHGDQGVLNACMRKFVNELRLLENSLWSQHWTADKDVIIPSPDGMLNVTEGKRQRTCHSVGSTPKFFQPSHGLSRRTTHTGQQWVYAAWLRFLFSSPYVNPWEEFSITELLGPSKYFLGFDLIYFSPKIMELMNPEGAYGSGPVYPVNPNFLQDIIASHGIHRMMPFGGGSDSMSQYIRLAKNRGYGAKIVEVGSYVGGSIVTLALALQHLHPQLWSVESFMGNHDGSVDGLDLPSQAEYHRNINLWANLNINTIPLHSELASKRFGAQSLDMVFLDGNHSAEAVAADIKLWSPKLKSGGVLAGDDWDWESVREGVYSEVVPSRVKSSNDIWWTVVF